MMPRDPSSPVLGPSWLRAWAPALLWSCVIFGLSTIPGNKLPRLPELWNVDKLVHGAVYAVLGALCWHGARATSVRGRGHLVQVSAAVTCAALYGITDELHQAFTPLRSPDPFDVIADAGGGLVGALVCVAIVSRKTRG